MRVLFLGEGDLSGPARYFSAVLRWAKIPFDHRPDQAKIPKAWLKTHYDAVILSDYRYSSWSPGAREWLVEQVSMHGAGFLMIGGWASFTGLVGGYAGTGIERLLPVTCIRGDDRVQTATGAILLPSRNAGREDAGSPPIVCGYHRAIPKPGAQVTHVFRDVNYKSGRVSLGMQQPAVVLGHAGRARTAAFLTDCAPHWAGGLVDWGKTRVKILLARGISVEVGETYLNFLARLVKGAMKCLLVAVIGVSFARQPLWARGTHPPRQPSAPGYSGWMVYWDSEAGKQAILEWEGPLEEICIFAYQFDGSGNLVPASKEVLAMRDWLKNNQWASPPRLLMTIVNDRASLLGTQPKNAACVHEAIATPEAREEHLKQILAAAEGLDGVDIDYESLRLEDRAAFSAFIEELAKALHQRKKWLSVVLQPRTAATPAKDSAGSGVIDWAAIAPHVDRVKVMAYLYHYSRGQPGSIAPLTQVTQLTDYALGVIPAAKLCVVLHLGGFDWPDSGPGRAIEYREAQALAAVHHESIQLDEATQSGYFQYWDDQQRRHAVWIETAAGLGAKARALSQQGVPYIAFWRLGSGDPLLRDALSGR